jgi:gamma-glutamyltranspeptidase
VVVTRDGRVRLALTASGTPDAPAAVAQVLHRRLVDVWPLDRAVAAPRLGLAGPAATFELDRVRPGWARAMRRAGHRIQSMSGSAPVHALERDARGTLRAVSDPRTRGSARTVD